KNDILLDFYTDLDKNVAYGAQDPRERKHENRAEQRTSETCKDTKLDAPGRHKQNDVPDELQNSPVKSSMKNDVDWGDRFYSLVDDVMFLPTLLKSLIRGNSKLFCPFFMVCNLGIGS
ncbi:hypothetical protein S83_030185, partial [Arachis hypogaea]